MIMIIIIIIIHNHDAEVYAHIASRFFIGWLTTK